MRHGSNACGIGKHECEFNLALIVWLGNPGDVKPVGEGVSCG